MQNVTVSATALMARTSIAVVRNVQIPTLSKTVESWFNLFSVIQIDKSWSSCALSRALGCLLKRALGLDCFIYFIRLWEQLLSFLKFLFLPPFKPWAVIVLFFSFFPLLFDQQICQRTLLGFQWVVVALTSKAWRRQVNLIRFIYLFFSSLIIHFSLTEYFALIRLTALLSYWILC